MAGGVYEWQGAKLPKVPHFIHRRDDALFAFAAIWERWIPKAGIEPGETYCQLTTAPNGAMTPIHNRMPTIPMNAITTTSLVVIYRPQPPATIFGNSHQVV